MTPVLKAPRSMLLKLRYDGPLSNFAFNFNLRRCIKAAQDSLAKKQKALGEAQAQLKEAGAYTHSLFGST